MLKIDAIYSREPDAVVMHCVQPTVQVKIWFGEHSFCELHDTDQPRGKERAKRVYLLTRRVVNNTTVLWSAKFLVDDTTSSSYSQMLSSTLSTQIEHQYQEWLWTNAIEQAIEEA